MAAALPLPELLTEAKKQFLQLVTDPAVSSESRFGVPAAVTIAQAILESGWGRSGLFRDANNPFGIKYSHNSPDARYGAYVASTHEFISGKNEIVKAGFQVYPDLWEAFQAHAELLLRPHYAAAWKHRRDACAYAMSLGPKSPANPDGCGYATDPRYGAKLIELIEDLDLENAGEHWGATLEPTEKPSHGGDAAADPPATTAERLPGQPPAMHAETEGGKNVGLPQPATPSASHSEGDGGDKA